MSVTKSDLSKSEVILELTIALSKIEAVMSGIPDDSDDDNVIEFTTAVCNAKAELVDALYSLQMIDELK